MLELGDVNASADAATAAIKHALVLFDQGLDEIRTALQAITKMRRAAEGGPEGD